MTVYIAEHRKTYQEIFKQIFQEHGSPTAFYSEGNGFLNALKTAQNIELVIINNTLPDADGITLCTAARELISDPFTPIILFTSQLKGETVGQLMDAGATDIFHPDQIASFEDYIENQQWLKEPIAANVLLVEDSIAQAAVLRSFLQQQGMTVYTAANISEAMTHFKSVPIDIVITDIELKDNDNGLELVHNIRRLPDPAGNTPIIAATSHEQTGSRVHFLSRGVDRCLSKPVSLPELFIESKNLIISSRNKINLNHALEQANAAMAAKSRFLASASHELRTPLNAIIGFSHLLPDKIKNEPPEQSLEACQLINEAGLHLLSLIDEIIDNAKFEDKEQPLEYTDVDTVALLKDCQAYLKQDVEDKNIEFILDINDETTLNTDGRRLKQVLLNLISNAVKYGKEGGTISVKTFRPNADTLAFSVSDDGIGIDQKYHDQVFEFFNRLGAEASEIQGSGIGLSTSKALVEQLGGSMSFESELGKGTTFTFSVFDQRI
ncbi:MAG: response regulator [Cellvibrionaceae bacterium]